MLHSEHKSSGRRPGTHSSFLHCALQAGFGDAALACLLHCLADCPPAPPPVMPGQQHSQSDGCRAALRCLKLGPPADREHFSDETGTPAVGAARPCGRSAMRLLH